MKGVANYHLTLTGLIDHVEGVIGYEDTAKHKPNPEPILKALEVFNAKKESTIYIGDHENDMIAAKNAGVMTCAVTYSKRIKEMLNTQPDFAVDDLSQLRDLI
jgi:phosphoglycolate phosphatase-like HAD superfamily hydrolase